MSMIAAPDPDELRDELDRLDRIISAGLLPGDVIAVLEYRRQAIRRQLEADG